MIKVIKNDHSMMLLIITLIFKKKILVFFCDIYDISRESVPKNKLTHRHFRASIF